MQYNEHFYLSNPNPLLYVRQKLRSVVIHDQARIYSIELHSLIKFSKLVQRLEQAAKRAPRASTILRPETNSSRYMWAIVFL